jgi:hypothetical protein
MALVEVEVNTWVSLHTMWLEHPSHLTWDEEGKNPLLEWCFGQNIQPSTTLERVGHTWVVGPPGKGKHQNDNAVSHTIAPEEGKGLTIGAWHQLLH